MQASLLSVQQQAVMKTSTVTALIIMLNSVCDLLDSAGQQSSAIIYP